MYSVLILFVGRISAWTAWITLDSFHIHSTSAFNYTYFSYFAKYLVHIFFRTDTQTNENNMKRTVFNTKSIQSTLITYLLTSLM